jgi:TolA-binding protein
MNKIAVVIGSVAVLGIGAYFYFKPKATDEDLTGTNTTGTNTTGTNTTGTNTTGTNTTGAGSNSQPAGTNYTSPEQVAEDVKRIAEATELAKQIDAINTKINNLKQRILNTENVVFKQQIGIQIVNENKKLVPLVEKLKDLGYTESYGIAVKIR